MGLLRTGLKLGGAALIVREAGKVVNGQMQNKQQQAQQREAQQPCADTTRNYYDANEYVHQQWCNGQCNGRCNGGRVGDRDTTIPRTEAYTFVADKGRGPPAYAA